MVSKIKRAGIIAVLLTLHSFLFTSISLGGIYGYKTEEGYICFPEYRSGQTARNKASHGEGGFYRLLIYEPLIQRAAAEYGVEVALLKALIMAESRFNKRAVSKKGALGLTQLIPRTAREVGVTNPFNPEQNILGGAKYLSELLRRFNFKRELAIAAYNAGPTRVEAHGGIPPIKETKEFVNKVLQYYRMFRQEGF